MIIHQENHGYSGANKHMGAVEILLLFKESLRGHPPWVGLTELSGNQDQRPQRLDRQLMNPEPRRGRRG